MSLCPPDSLPRDFRGALAVFWKHPSPLLISAFSQSDHPGLVAASFAAWAAA